MTATSKFGYWVTPIGTLTNDRPMSAATARWFVNNARHLIDQSTQTRVNWVAWAAANSILPSAAAVNKAGLTWSGGGTAWQNICTHFFPVCITGANTAKLSYRRPSNLVVSVAGYTESGDELFFRAVVQPEKAPIGFDLVNNQCLAYFEGSTTSNTSTWVIDSSTTNLYPAELFLKTRPRNFSVAEYDGNIYDIEMFPLRLSIYAKEGKSGGTGHLTAVYVRECQL